MIFVNSSDLELARNLRIISNRLRSYVVLNGVDLPTLQGASSNQGNGSIRILFIGRLSEQKGVDLLVDAAALLRQPSHVRIVGDGPLRAELKARASSKDCEVQWEFLGHRNDVQALLSEADIVVLPSRWEGHSIAVLEAMASGKPVIATAIKGNIETIAHGDDGLLVAPNSVTELCSAIELLGADAGLRSRLGDSARRKVARSLSRTAMVKTTFDVYEDLGLPVTKELVQCAE
jgi:glycosyltransferase involved in cell wall biosynthesis